MKPRRAGKLLWVSGLECLNARLDPFSTLLERGANPQLEDEFGHTAWLVALNRSMEDAEFARRSIAALFERIAPHVLDVQVDMRLVRLERHQGEYWVLNLMLAGFNILRTRCVEHSHPHYKYEVGFFAESLQTALECLPEHLWKTQRRKRSYVNAVLARGEALSQYQPARRLWVRTEIGHYLPNPLLQLRTHSSEGPDWRPLFQVLNLPWMDAGTRRSESRMQKSLEILVERAKHRVTTGEDVPEVF